MRFGANGEWTTTLQGQNWWPYTIKGLLVKISVREGDTWKCGWRPGT